MTPPEMAGQVVGALGDVSDGFRDLAIWLRRREFVKSAVHPVWVSSTEHVRVEWFADAELVDGKAVSFALELRLERDEWIIEPAIRVIDESGEEDLLELASSFAVGDKDLLAELKGASTHLLGLRDRVWAELGLEQ